MDVILSCHKIDTYVERFQQNYAPPSYWNSESPPYSMDWRSRNAVTGIKDQVAISPLEYWND